ncbi:putative dehydrogenase [Confluentimicrobium naphthalenivorans]|uniref:Putative dehydrogenase n=1 Tax=Actibacterium naphthalenivorans TaxID=1614693 RepID=A0A840CD40_9RHOB|nr:putative dehydrogenase [Actibacterium naphthalenivorans]
MVRSRPRLGFLGLGWIGRNRMEAMAATDMGEIVAYADLDPQAVAESDTLAATATRTDSLEEILALQPDGVVIATPSALHAQQAIQALEAGASVFCQKPLGRNAGETAAVVAAARAADRLLATDMSYRHTAAVRAIAAEIASGGMGEICAVDLTFHNAYGPDKPWFRNRALSGGGCLIDLGVHLVDLALWLLDWPQVECTAAALKAAGRPLDPAGEAVEDLAFATLDTATGVPIRLACSWNLPAGCDCVLRLDFFGTKGGVSIVNRGGSFFNFEAWRHDGCETRLLSAPPDDWGGRAAVDWLSRLAHGEGFDAECAQLVTVARTLDAIYARAGFPEPESPSVTKEMK